MDKLKPCPFCGGEVEMVYVGSSDWQVTCKGCPVETNFWVSGHQFGHGEGETKEACRRWNRRALTADAGMERAAEICRKSKMFDMFMRQNFWHAHHVDLVWRYNGEDVREQADWLKDLWYAIRAAGSRHE